MDATQYDRTIVAFSGGKDSLACVLWAIENNCPNIELWHHKVDGAEGSTLMDWPITDDYCRQVAAHLGLPIYFSWLEGGFEREMLRDESAKARTFFETPDGLSYAGGNSGKASTRLKFPQVSADLNVRWCSSYLKIDVCSMAISNQSRFENKRTLLITGERAEESASRSKYAVFEPDRSDNRGGKKARWVDRLRPIHGYTEMQVWALIARHRITPHPAYYLGWGRLSCMRCIFGSVNQWATIRQIDPVGFTKVSDYEEEFGYTIQRKASVSQLADRGVPYPSAADTELVALAMGQVYDRSMLMVPWVLPDGAFGESNGPT
jgi:3'-phosphoadenosine 5'-phosphosulfate sulfotransferase (PAPS reductase)/FAD synthetase